MINTTNLYINVLGYVHRKTEGDFDESSPIGLFSPEGKFYTVWPPETESEQPGIRPHELQEIAYLGEAYAEYCAPRINPYTVVIGRLDSEDNSFIQFENMTIEQATKAAEEELQQAYASDNEGEHCPKDFYCVTCITSDTEMVVNHQ